MKPIRSEAHKRWIRTLPCVIASCGRISKGGKLCRGRVEAAHTGPHGMDQKASDLDTIPACMIHHDELGGPGGRRAFEEKYGLNINEILERLKKKPRIFISRRYTVPESRLLFVRWFVAEFESETFWLCPVSGIPHYAVGIKAAWRICKDLCCKDRLRIAS